MKFLIKFWLKARIPLSNFLNRFDKFNIEPKEKISFPNCIFAIKHLNFLLDNFYVYKYDLGDRIRTPNAVWNRTHSKNGLKDDCDGASTLAFSIFKECESIQTVKLITVVPTDSFWSGHTLCIFKEKEDSGFKVVDYGTVFDGFNSLEDIIHFIVQKQYSRFNTFVVSLDIFEHDKWKNQNVFYCLAGGDESGV